MRILVIYDDSTKKERNELYNQLNNKPRSNDFHTIILCHSETDEVEFVRSQRWNTVYNLTEKELPSFNTPLYLRKNDISGEILRGI